MTPTPHPPTPTPTTTTTPTPRAPETISYSELLAKRGQMLDRVILRARVLLVSVRGAPPLFRIRRPTPADADVRIIGTMSLRIAADEVVRLLEEAGGKLGLSRKGYEKAEAVIEIVEEVAGD